MTPVDPCDEIQCGANAECMLINGDAKCLCKAGFTGSNKGVDGCLDVDECSNSPCAKGAVCRNEPGTFVCECPTGMEPLSSSPRAPYTEGCKNLVEHECDESSPCPPGEQCIKNGKNQNVCTCLLGFVRDVESGRCRDIDECFEDQGQSPCGISAICKNLPGSYECHCPQGYHGNPFLLCEGILIFPLEIAL